MGTGVDLGLRALRHGRVGMSVQGTSRLKPQRASVTAAGPLWCSGGWGFPLAFSLQVVRCRYAELGSHCNSNQVPQSESRGQKAPTVAMWTGVGGDRM